VDVQGEKQRFDVLGLHEFDSDRKRMAVVLGSPQHQKVLSKSLHNPENPSHQIKKVQTN
ncbi:hypothetical protein Dimus_020430, partial [Dionaea muscipula]